MKFVWIVMPSSLFAGLALAAVACGPSSADTAETNGDIVADQNATSDTTTGTHDETCLGKAGLSFDLPECQSCMNEAACCKATIGCFVDDADCGALQACMQTCGGGPGSGTGTGGGKGDGGGDGDGGGNGNGDGGGNGNGDGGGNGNGNGNGNGGGGGNGNGGGSGDGGSSDAGVDPTATVKACQDACKAKHASGLPAWQSFNACVTGTCAASCL
jgi:hypothetical protein